MSQQSEYYDPDTGIIHMWLASDINASTGATDSFELGLENTTFNDVKFKLLSIEYRIKLFCSNLSPTGSPPADNNSNAFNDEFAGAAGSIIVGIANKSETMTTFNDLDAFTGTSAWPVGIAPYATLIGNPASFSKTWKPRKVALSNEQNAFLVVRQDNTWPGVGEDTAVTGWGSIYIRGVRL